MAEAECQRILDILNKPEPVKAKIENLLGLDSDSTLTAHQEPLDLIQTYLLPKVEKLSDDHEDMPQTVECIRMLNFDEKNELSKRIIDDLFKFNQNLTCDEYRRILDKLDKLLDGPQTDVMAKGNGSTQNEETVDRTPSTCSDLDQVQCVTTNVTEHLEQLQESVAELKTGNSVILRFISEIKNKHHKLKEFISRKQKQHDQEISTLSNTLLALMEKFNYMHDYKSKMQVDLHNRLNARITPLEDMLKNLEEQFRSVYLASKGRVYGDILFYRDSPKVKRETILDGTDSKNLMESVTSPDSYTSITSNPPFIPPELKRETALDKTDSENLMESVTSLDSSRSITSNPPFIPPELKRETALDETDSENLMESVTSLDSYTSITSNPPFIPPGLKRETTMDETVQSEHI